MIVARRARWLAIAVMLRGFVLGAQTPVPVRAPADTDALSRAYAAERTGTVAEAVRQFGLALTQHPANAAALMGMERSLPRVDRRPEIIPYVHRALAVDSTSVGVLLVAVRAFATLGHGDSAAKYAARWARQVPRDESPYREWAMAAQEVRDLPQAQTALETGRTRLGPPALSLELAQLLQAEGQMAAAAREWIGVIRATPTYRDGAASVLAQVPAGQRAAVRDALARDGSVDAKRLLGLLEIQWGSVPEGAATIRAALPADRTDAISLLTSALAAMHGRQDAPSLIARGAVLEAVAAREVGESVTRTLLDAARAYADGGDEQNARRLLARVSADPSAPQGMATTASTTMLGVLIAEGKAAEAESVFRQLAKALSPDDRAAAARRVANAWIRAGDLARAEALVAADSSVDGLDLLGRVRLYRGDLAGATKALEVAGPFDDQRDAALRRVTLLSLMQAVSRDSLPPLGAALFALARGDSARAVAGLEAVGATLDSGAGAAETRLLAGRIALARRDTVTATRLLHLADVATAPAPAAAARLDLARISAAAGRADEARALLEGLILDFPESAVVPEARHLRDMLHGAIPGGGE